MEGLGQRGLETLGEAQMQQGSRAPCQVHHELSATEGGKGTSSASRQQMVVGGGGGGGGGLPLLHMHFLMMQVVSQMCSAVRFFSLSGTVLYHSIFPSKKKLIKVSYMFPQ